MFDKDQLFGQAMPEAIKNAGNDLCLTIASPDNEETAN
jgi:hypothetical protein